MGKKDNIDIDFDFDFDFDNITIIDKRDSEILVKEAMKNGNYKQCLSSAKAFFQKGALIHFENIQNIDKLLSFPKPSEQYRIVTQQHFNTFSFILSIIEKEGKIKNLTVLTFNMNEPTISALTELFDLGMIDNLWIVISDSIKFRMPKRVEQLRQCYEERKKTNRYNVAFIWNHAKIALVQTTNNFYIIEGSGNFSSNAEIEQYVFENNQSVYDFHRGWIMDCIFNEKRKSHRHEILGEVKNVRKTKSKNRLEEGGKSL